MHIKAVYAHVNGLKGVIQERLNQAPLVTLMIFISSLYLIYLAVKAVTLLYFHPLSKVPGPLLAAVSQWYDFYYNVIYDGTYSKQWLRLHEEYKSPVIRIGVNQVHIADAALYHEIYCSKTEYYKDPSFYRRLGLDGAILTITDPSQHRLYRNAINSLFSTKTTDQMGPTMELKLKKAAGYMLNQGKQDRPITTQRLYRSISADMTTELMFEIHFPFINTIVASFPTWLVNMFLPGWLGYRKKFETWLAEAKDRSTSSDQTVNKRATFYDLVFKSRLETGHPAMDPTLLVDDTYNYIIAGMDTTSYTLAFATYYILTIRGVKEKLQRELDDAEPFIRANLDWKKVQQLPYLSAVVREALRVSVVAPGGLPRLAPPEGTQVGPYFLPKGTVISMSHQVVQMNADLFPDPEAFIPERWLDRDRGEATEKWNIAFSKGSRQCIGMNLAYLELYTCIAYFFSHFDMELFETDQNTLKSVDHFAARTKSQVKVKIVQDRWAEKANSGD